MTGKFFFVDQNKEKFKKCFYYYLNYKKDQKHDRVIFIFDKKKLIYNDVRKFGFIKCYINNAFEKNTHFKNLGPEPLSKQFNKKYLKNYISGRRRVVKSILMDQKCVSGLGNIYVNEILFKSAIKPLRQVSKLKNYEINKIILNTKKILKKSIKFGGSSIKDFSSTDGKKGQFQQKFKVYNKKGEICSNIDCNKTIIRTIVSNRSSFFCPKCQK